jgi:hypothetical protein
VSWWRGSDAIEGHLFQQATGPSLLFEDWVGREIPLSWLAVALTEEQQLAVLSEVSDPEAESLLPRTCLAGVSPGDGTLARTLVGDLNGSLLESSVTASLSPDGQLLFTGVASLDDGTWSVVQVAGVDGDHLIAGP